MKRHTLPAALAATLITSPLAAQEAEVVQHSDLRRIAYAGFGTSGFALGAGTFFLVRHLQLEGDGDAADEADDARTWMAVSFAAGGLLLATSVTLLLVEPDTAGGVAAAPAPGGGVLVWSGRF